MDNYLGNEIGKTLNERIPGANELAKIGLRNNNIEQTRNIQDQKSHISELQNLVTELQNQLHKERQRTRELSNALEDAQDDLEETQEKLQEYVSLLCKPMVEIAVRNKNFKETYEKEQVIIADWIVSQKAFKELAIEFGFAQGLSPEEVKVMGANKKLDVLENKHNESHGTNASDSPLVFHRAEILIAKLKAN